MTPWRRFCADLRGKKVTLVDVLVSAVQVSRKAKEDGSFARWVSVQGIMHLDGGKQEVFVDSIFPDRDDKSELKALAPGRYSLTPRIALDYKTRQPIARGFTYQLVKA